MGVYLAARGSPKAGAKAASLVPLALASVLAFFLLDWGWRATLASRAIAAGETRWAHVQAWLPLSKTMVGAGGS